MKTLLTLLMTAILSAASFAEPAPAGSVDSQQVAAEPEFTRIVAADGTKMIYKEIPVPEGARALELTWKWRVSGLVRGSQPWFDARIMMELLDADRNKVSTPPAPHTGRDTDGWEDGKVVFEVPETARIIKFMPSLLNVKSGTLDLAEYEFKAVDPDTSPELQERAAAARRKLEARADRAAKRMERLGGDLVENGDFSEPEQNGNIRGWGRSSAAMSLQSEAAEDGAENPFLRISVTEQNKILGAYREYDLPANIDALSVRWRERVTGLKTGEKPWFDARILFEFRDAAGRKMEGAPSASYTQRDTKGWRDRERQFLVPEGAVSFVFYPVLFQAKAGTFDLDDISIRSCDAAPVLAEAERQKRMDAMRYVAPEKADPARFPSAVRVVGPDLINDNGEKVWLQGVCLSGMESVPNDRQAEKSTVVAIDDWKGNCIRLPVNETFWFGRSDYQNDGGKAYRELCDRVITLAANRGAYVVLDLHRFRAPKQEHVEFWKDAGKRYANHPAVLFDLFNEPHGISWDIWRDGGWVGNAEKRDESAFLSEEEKRKNQGFESVGMQALLDAVRSVGAENVVIAGGLAWANDLTGITKGYTLSDPDGRGIVYSWHTYNWHPGWAKILPVLEQAPVFLGECGGDEKKMGFIPSDIQEDPNTFCPDLLGFVQKHRIHWTGFSMHTGATPRLLSDWAYTPTPFWGAYVVRALGGEQFEMKRMR